MSSEGVVKLNVGGNRYEVARSLLEAHPDTMVARMVSEDWQQNSEAEIFIERDGTRFKYFLDYLRDGKICLPLSVAKTAILDDLKYYGVDAGACVKYDDIAISEVNSLFLNKMSVSEKALEELTDEEKELTEEIQRVETELRDLKETKLDASNRVKVFRGARVIYEIIISEVVKCDPSPGFPSELTIDLLEESSNSESRMLLKFLVEKQEDYFDTLKAYLCFSFGIELICMRKDNGGYTYDNDYTSRLVVEFIVKPGTVLKNND